MRRMAWYKEWFGEDYLELYSHRDEPEAEAHIDFVEHHLGPSRDGWPHAVLDLACGAGRHTAALALGTSAASRKPPSVRTKAMSVGTPPASATLTDGRNPALLPMKFRLL